MLVKISLGCKRNHAIPNLAKKPMLHYFPIYGLLGYDGVGKLNISLFTCEIYNVLQRICRRIPKKSMWQVILKKRRKKTNQIFNAKRMKDNFKYCQKKILPSSSWLRELWKGW